MASSFFITLSLLPDRRLCAKDRHGKSTTIQIPTSANHAKSAQVLCSCRFCFSFHNPLLSKPRSSFYFSTVGVVGNVFGRPAKSQNLQSSCSQSWQLVQSSPGIFYVDTFCFRPEQEKLSFSFLSKLQPSRLLLSHVTGNSGNQAVPPPPPPPPKPPAAPPPQPPPPPQLPPAAAATICMLTPSNRCH